MLRTIEAFLPCLLIFGLISSAGGQQLPTCVQSPHGSVPFGEKVYSPDGKYVAREVEPKNMGKIGIFNRKTNERIKVIEIGETKNDLKGLCFSPDGTWIAVMYHHGSGGYIAIMDVNSGNKISSIPITKWYHYMIISSDGKAIISEGDKLPIGGMLPRK